MLLRFCTPVSLVFAALLALPAHARHLGPITNGINAARQNGAHVWIQVWDDTRTPAPGLSKAEKTAVLEEIEAEREFRAHVFTKKFIRSLGPDFHVVQITTSEMQKNPKLAEWVYSFLYTSLPGTVLMDNVDKGRIYLRQETTSALRALPDATNDAKAEYLRQRALEVKAQRQIFIEQERVEKLIKSNRAALRQHPSLQWAFEKAAAEKKQLLLHLAPSDTEISQQVSDLLALGNVREDRHFVIVEIPLHDLSDLGERQRQIFELTAITPQHAVLLLDSSGLLIDSETDPASWLNDNHAKKGYPTGPLLIEDFRDFSDMLRSPARRNSKGCAGFLIAAAAKL